MTVPCKDCADRRERCHSECIRYKLYSDECQSKYKERELDVNYMAYKTTTMDRMRRGKYVRMPAKAGG